MEELGINSGISSSNSTYKNQDVMADEIIRSHTTILENVFHAHLATERKTIATNILDTKTSQDTVQSTIYCRFKFMHHH